MSEEIDSTIQRLTELQERINHCNAYPKNLIEEWGSVGEHLSKLRYVERMESTTKTKEQR
jgi:hypothetical protein